MGGFLGIGTSPEEKAMEEQKKRAREEAEQSRRDAEVRLAEKRAKKGQETAQIELGDETAATTEKALDTTKSLTNVSTKLGLGGNKITKKRKTGVQL